MRNANHTPGPWKANEAGDWAGVEAITEDGSVVRREICTCLTDEDEDWRAEDIANLRLIAVAPDLLASWEPDRDVAGPDFLDWVADRLVRVHGEPAGVDFVLKLRRMAEMGRAALSKVGGQP